MNTDKAGHWRVAALHIRVVPPLEFVDSLPYSPSVFIRGQIQWSRGDGNGNFRPVMNCQHIDFQMNRRDFFSRFALGMGGMALGSLLARDGFAAAPVNPF